MVRYQGIRDPATRKIGAPQVSRGNGGVSLVEPKAPPVETEPTETELDKLRKRLKKGQTMFLTAGEAVGYGYQLEQGWLLKVTPERLTVVTPDKWEIDPQTNIYFSPEGTEYTQEELTALYEQQQAAPPTPAAPPEAVPPLTAGEARDLDKRLRELSEQWRASEDLEERRVLGEEISAIEKRLREPVAPTEPVPVTGIQPEIEGMLQRLFPQYFATTQTEAGVTITSAEEMPLVALERIFTRAETEPQVLMEEIFQMGRSNDTEALLRLFNPDMTLLQMGNFFAAPDPYGQISSQITNIFNVDDVESLMNWAAEEPDTFYQEIKDTGLNEDTWNLMKTLHPEASEEELALFFQEPVKPVMADFLQGVQTGFQYVEGWWKTGLMTLGFRYGNLMDWSAGNDEQWYSEAEKMLDDAFKRHGWKAIFTSEVNEAWDVYFPERIGAGGFATGLKVVSEFSNPIYLLPATKVAQVLIRPFRAVPILGETMQALANVVGYAERGLAEATLIPSLGRGLKYTAGKIAERNLASKYLIAELPQREVLRGWLFQNDYFRKLAVKVPLLGKIAPSSSVSARLPEVLSTRAEAGAAVIQETAMRNAILETGQSTKGQALAYLRELGTTKEIYGVRNAMVSPRLVKPKGDYSLALGDVLQAPERYDFTHRYGFEYAKRTQKLMSEMFALAKKEGVNINELELQPFEEYVHWVVTGVKDADGKVISKYVGRPRGVGGVPSSMKPRRFESMLDGLKDGFVYADDVEVYVQTYVDDMFKAIGDKRYGEGITEIVGRLSKELGALPVSPKDRLWAYYPETAQHWMLRKPTARIGEVPTIRETVADLGYAISATQQLARGQQISGSTLRAIKNRLPMVGQQIDNILTFKGDRATKPKLEALIWKRMQAGQSLPATLPTERAAVKDYVAQLNKEQVKTFYQKFAKLEQSTALNTQLRGELGKVQGEWWVAKGRYAEKLAIVRKPLQKMDEGYIRTASGLPHPMFNNQIYPSYIADQATLLLNDEVNKLLSVTAQISGAFRLQQAALDISAGVIQGFVGMFSHPVKWTKAQAWALAALADTKVFNGYLVRHAETIAQRNYYLGSQRPFEYFEQMGLLQRYIGKIPFGKAVLGQTYGRAEAAFSMFSTVYKNEMWQALSPNAIKRGQGAELARMLDRMTGMTSFRQLGMPANARAFASGWVSFAPQYRVSVLSYFADAFKGGYTGAMVRKDLARMVAGGTAAYYAFCQITGNPVYLNPYTDGKKFMSINVDGHWIGMGSAVVSMMRASVDILASALSIGDNEPMDFLTIDKWKNPILRALIGQSAVLPQQILELATRRDYLGYPLGNPFEDPDAWANWGKWVGEQFTPIWLQEILYDKSGIPPSLTSVLAEFIGLRTSPQTRWETLDDKLKERKVWDALKDLTDEQRDRIENRDETVMSVLDAYQKKVVWQANEDLVPFYEEAETDALIRSTEVWQDYVRGIKNAQTTMTTDLNDAFTFGIKEQGEDTRWLRERYSEVMGDYGLLLGFLRENDDLEVIFAEFDEKKEKRKLDAETFDLAYWDYIEKVVAPDRRTDTGDYDFEEYSEALEVWREEWGDEVYDKVLYILERAKEAIPNYPDWGIKLWEDRKLLNDGGYWELPPKSISQMDARDLADGLVPEEYLTLWEQYQSITTKEEKERFVAKYPEFGKDWRTEFRTNNPEADATLAFWGYGGSLQTIEAYNLVKGWADTLGIPLEQIGLGLPPDRIVSSYFEHIQLVRDTSGNSPEVRLFKLKNPDLLSWGVAQRGWDELKSELVPALEVRVNYKQNFSEYEAFGDELSESYIEDDTARREARKQYMVDNPAFRDDSRRLDVFKTGVLDVAVVEGNVEYGVLVDQHGASSSEAKLFRYRNGALDEWGRNKDYHGENAWTALEIERVPIWEIDETWSVEDDAYQAILDKFPKSNKDQRAATKAYLAANPEYADKRRVRDALELGWRDEDLISTYVDYYRLPDKGFWKERYLRDNQGLYTALKDADLIKVDYEFDKIPDVQYDLIYDTWSVDFDAYADLNNNKDRENYLITRPDFAMDKWRRDAHYKLIPQEYVDNYADYQKILFDGKPTLLSPEWYEDDWYLMENPQFYSKMVEMGLWKPDYKDFSKVPSKDVFKLYQTYLALPYGSPRKAYRGVHPDLDAWLVLSGKVSKSIPELERAAEIGRWGVWAEQFSEYLRQVEELYEQRKTKSIQDLADLQRRLDELKK